MQLIQSHYNPPTKKAANPQILDRRIENLSVLNSSGEIKKLIAY